MLNYQRVCLDVEFPHLEVGSYGSRKLPCSVPCCSLEDVGVWYPHPQDCLLKGEMTAPIWRAGSSSVPSHLYLCPASQMTV